MENTQYRNLKTSLQLNGPILSFVKHPEDRTVGAGETTTFTGFATATFPTQDPANPAVGYGTISYRWYEVGVGPIIDSDVTGIVGAGTTLLHFNCPSSRISVFLINQL